MLFLPKEVETVITTLQGAGYSPYLVGGCVREMLRGKAPSDYDMTSDALPQEVLRLFGEWAHPTGLQHGTVTVVSGGLPIELTTMRRDGAYRDNRHPDSVTFGTSIGGPCPPRLHGQRHRFVAGRHARRPLRRAGRPESRRPSLRRRAEAAV